MNQEAAKTNHADGAITDKYRKGEQTRRPQSKKRPPRRRNVIARQEKPSSEAENPEPPRSRDAPRQPAAGCGKEKSKTARLHEKTIKTDKLNAIANRAVKTTSRPTSGAGRLIAR